MNSKSTTHQDARGVEDARFFCVTGVAYPQAQPATCECLSAVTRMRLIRWEASMLPASSAVIGSRRE